MCGIIALNGDDSLKQAHAGLQLLQHRGQDGFGLWASKEDRNFTHKQAGLVNTYKISKDTNYNIALGHTRYSTIGKSNPKDLQPLIKNNLILCHNGNVTNISKIKSQFTDYNFQTKNDAEIFLAYLESANLSNIKNIVSKILHNIEGAYSLVGALDRSTLFAFKDPKGMKPLFMATKAGATAFASEMQALYFLGFKEIQEVKAGELIVADQNGVIIREQLIRQKAKPCMFEWVYFAGVEGEIHNLAIYQARLNLGKALANKITNIEAIDIVAPVPDTSRTSAIALSEAINKPYREILIKNRYVQRSFILNTQADRERAILWKLMPVLSEIQGKNILLVDDSIVRGTTAKRIVKVLKESGAKSVKIASACPPLRHPCFYGIDFPKQKELIAHKRNSKEIAKVLGAEAVYYLDQEDLYKALKQESFCMACVNGDYPYAIDQNTLLQERQV